MSDFFDDNSYEVPVKPGKYMKFKKGENTIRILGTFSEGTAIKGYEYWVTGKDGGRVPVRKEMDDEIKMADLEEGEDSVKHFWAMPVYNYNDEAVQILEITQISIIKAITSLAKNKAWGSPTGYDLVINRIGDGLLTKYEVIPQPPKEASKEILKKYSEIEINIRALFKGDDPFAERNDALPGAMYPEVIN